MTGEQGTRCPECGAPRGADNTPSCDCTERAAEALREARTAEAAAAEDFDPLRIRPYVEVPDAAPPGPAAPPLANTGGEVSRPAPPEAPTEPLPGVAPEPAPPRRRSRLLPAAAGAGTVIVTATAFALFSYHAPARDRGAQEIRERIPTAPTQAPASAKTPPPPPAPVPPAPSASPTPTPTPSPASPSPSATPSPTLSRTTSPTPSTTVSGTPRATPAVAPVLRLGDTGPQVTELQQRLRQLNLYGDRVDGVFTRTVQDAVRNYQLARGIMGDVLGEYGPATRKSLEGETTKP
ncbi:peptidoglycan-binding domain-containing protein [Streptomyces cyanogenus]|uniref:Peptidoglycan binding domain protein n=1 Tax=Streptomyces cyanogenus TaxID=80860 RepID=A0ABX7TSJ4_STRCY|nr:peptidoglycan-binding domain-containing protein [Streptomyces cyanogenus]QTD98280.1 Putative peptidoglycan binding domain protein [Streptomyces cyanogenus]